MEHRYPHLTIKFFPRRLSIQRVPLLRRRSSAGSCTSVQWRLAHRQLDVLFRRRWRQRRCMSSPARDIALIITSRNMLHCSLLLETMPRQRGRGYSLWVSQQQ